MKSLNLIIVFLIFGSSLFAQNNHNNAIEFRMGYGGADAVPAILSTSFAYSRHIAYGIMIKPSFMMNHGGRKRITLDNLDPELQQDFFNSHARSQSGLDDLPTSSFFQMRSYGLGIQKSINTTKKASLNVLLGVRGTHYSAVKIRGVGFNSESRYFTFSPQYETTFTFNYEVELSYYHQLNDYLRAFAAVNAITELFYFGAHVGLAVGF